MADTFAGAAAGVGLLTTKLHLPPVPSSGVVGRPRLAQRLEAGADGVVLVSAPAGYGKSALLADWSRDQRHPVAWLSLDTGDNDPARFWRHAAAAMESLRPGIAELVTPMIGTTSLQDLITVLVNELADGSAGLLVLDDYHLIESDQIHTSVRLLLDHRPSGLGIVLASRADPPLPLGRLRSTAQLTELRAADLRFTNGEAAELLGRTVDAAVNDETAGTLVARTEGWAAGLQMAGLSLRERDDVAGFVASFSGSHRHVTDFLVEEVLDHQPAEVRSFLTETSVLERLSGPLCDAVTGRSDGQQMLEAIEGASLFLEPLDEVRGWWRYHQLFAELLQRRLRNDGPERALALHRAAGAWHAEHDLAEDAIRHAFAADDPEWAAQLLERHADELLERRQDTTVQRWLTALPPEMLDTKPRIVLGQARLALFGGRLGEAEALLDAAEKADANTADDLSNLTGDAGASAAGMDVRAEIVSLRGWRELLRGEPEEARRFAGSALHELGDRGGPHEAATYAHLAGADHLAGRLAEAERGFVRSLALWHDIGDRDMRAWMNIYLGRLHRDRGALTKALEAFHEATELASGSEGPPLPAAGPAHVGIAEVAYARGELDTAREQITTAVSLCRRFAYARSQAVALSVQARVLQATGDVAGSRQAMQEAFRLTDPDVVDVYNLVSSQRARLALAQGDADPAADWTTGRGLQPDDNLSYANEPAYLILARVLLVQNQAGAALGLLDRLHGAAIDQARTASRIQIQAVRALSLAADGDEREAVAVVEDALVLACREGHRQVFVDEGPAMAELIGRFIATRQAEQTTVDLGYLARLLRAFDPAEPGTMPSAATQKVVGMVTQLTEREIDVLRMLAAGRRNQQIADELYVAVSTVKSHVTHIFDKLGATNRTQATTRARELGLID